MRRVSPSLLFVVVLLLNGPPPRAVQIQLPETPAGRQCAAWQQAFNGSHREAYRAFLQKNFPSRAEHLDQEWGVREMTGGFELRKLEESTPTKVVALVQGRASDQFGRLTLEVEAAEPHRIANLELRAIPRPAEFALPHMSESALLTALRKKLEEDAAAEQFAGAALLAKNGKPIFAKAYGLADRENRIPAISDGSKYLVEKMQRFPGETVVLHLTLVARRHLPWSQIRMPIAQTSSGPGGRTFKCNRSANPFVASYTAHMIPAAAVRLPRRSSVRMPSQEPPVESCDEVRFGT